MSLDDANVQDGQDATLAETYAFTAFAISTIVASFYFVGIQYLLVKARSPSPTLRPPTVTETYLIVTFFWTAHSILDKAIYSIVDLYVAYSLSHDPLKEYHDLRATDYNPGSSFCVTSVPLPQWLTLLLYKVLTTWLIAQSLLLVLEAIIPLFRDIRKNPQFMVLKFQARSLELLEFARELYESPEPAPSRSRIESFPKVDRNSQAINLKRHQGNHEVDDERVLNWDLTIDKHALDEMKEILGPSGGFGELGFNVATDRVSFACMSSKSSFNLTFAIEEKARTRRQDLKALRSKSWYK